MTLVTDLSTVPKPINRTMEPGTRVKITEGPHSGTFGVVKRHWRALADVETDDGKVIQVFLEDLEPVVSH